LPLLKDEIKDAVAVVSLLDAYKTLAQCPLHQFMTEEKQKLAQMRLKNRFFPTEDHFSVQRVPSDGSIMQVTLVTDGGPSPRDVLATTLDSSKTGVSISWEGLLYTSRDLVIEVACMSRIVHL
jgi:hypothetical protein